MKKLVLLIACTVIATSAFAQGTINFTNMKPSKQIITDADGNNFEGGFAQLYAGNQLTAWLLWVALLPFTLAKRLVTSRAVLLTLASTALASSR